MTSSLPFDISQTPGPGLTVIEASAGTGKTYSIAGLALLGFARGEFSPREVCVVTFTDAATAELAGRLRARIVQGIDALMTPPEDWGHITDTVDILLIEPDSDDEEGRRSRLEHLRRELIRVLDACQEDQQGGHQPVGVGGRGRGEIDRIGENAAQQQLGDGRGQLPATAHVHMRDDGAR